MATLPQTKLSDAQIIDEAASKISQILEEHFDEMGLSDEERNERVARAGARVDAAVLHAKSSEHVSSETNF